VAAHTQDDGFHEIQLNGKQLVFLFMAATVVSVVIFLCGVLVGRGVPIERGTEADAAGLSTAAEPTPQAPAPDATPTPAGSDPTAAAAPPTVDDLSYFDRLESSTPSPEKLKAPEPAVQPAAAPAKPPTPVAAAPAKAPARPAAAAVNAAAPPGGAYAVQIAALNVRSEADAIAKRMTSKGYAAYVLSPASGTPQIYRVRIGKFGSRREAETMATKLEKEEQFKPWVTR
jgi:septal ring-binding cell division protein DamX